MVGGSHSTCPRAGNGQCRQNPNTATRTPMKRMESRRSEAESAWQCRRGVVRNKSRTIAVGRTLLVEIMATPRRKLAFDHLLKLEYMLHNTAGEVDVLASSVIVNNALLSE